MGTRREQVLDAAMRVLGTQGTHRLTHRAVDTEAAVPEGTTSNYFRTRDALLTGVLRRVAELETAGWRRFADELGQPDLETFADAVARFARTLAGEHRVVTLARHAIVLEAAFHDGLRREVAAQRAGIEAWGSDWLRELGSTRPVEDFWSLLALLDGLLSRQCTEPDPRFDPAPAIGALLRGLLAPDPDSA